MITKETWKYINYWYWRIEFSGTNNQRRAWAEIRQAGMNLQETVNQLLRLCRYYEELEANGVTIA